MNVLLGHFFPGGRVLFIHLDEVDNTWPSTMILVSSQSLFLEGIRGDTERLNTKFALYGSKNQCAGTDTVVFPLGWLPFIFV